MTRAEIQPLVRDRRPLYVQAVTPILDLAADRSLGPGDRLPSEVELAEALGVGRSTIREAIRQLELAGLVERRRGIGTVILRTYSAVAMGLERLEPLDALARRQGWQCRTSEIEIGAEPATAEQASRLQVAVGAPISIVTRIKTRDALPFAELISFVPTAVVPTAELRALFRDSITDLLGPGGLSRLGYARAEVNAIACDAARAARLGLEAGQPLLVVDELFIGANDEVLAWNLVYCASGTLRLEVLRLLPQPGSTAKSPGADTPTAPILV